MEIKVGTMMKFRHNIMNVSSIGTFENIKGVLIYGHEHTPYISIISNIYIMQNDLLFHKYI